MKLEDVTRLIWHLDHGYDGIVQVWVIQAPGAVKETQYTINGLHELPEAIAQVIREAGELRGEWPAE